QTVALELQAVLTGGAECAHEGHSAQAVFPFGALLTTQHLLVGPLYALEFVRGEVGKEAGVNQRLVEAARRAGDDLPGQYAAYSHAVRIVMENVGDVTRNRGVVLVALDDGQVAEERA